MTSVRSRFLQEQLSRCVEFLRALLWLYVGLKLGLAHQKWALKSGTYIHFQSKAKQLQAIALVKWQLIMMAKLLSDWQFRVTLSSAPLKTGCPQLHFWYQVISWGQLKSQLLTEETFLTSSDNDFANAFITFTAAGGPPSSQSRMR